MKNPYPVITTLKKKKKNYNEKLHIQMKGLCSFFWSQNLVLYLQKEKEKLASP